MADREKVMKALKCRVTDPVVECGNCPYNDAPDDWRQRCDFHRLCADALALLREQEPRVMTLDEVCGGDECWIEYRYGGHGYADVYLEEPDGTAKVYRCRPVGDRKPETVWLHDYGKLWRGWSYRPSPEQMRDAKWEGDNDE